VKNTRKIKKKREFLRSWFSTKSIFVFDTSWAD